MTFTKVQEQIITTDKPYVLVASAAASGKTQTLVGRIQYLLEQGVPPEEIVAITFTNNAAAVMFERLNYPSGLFIGTIHSYCNYLLRGNAIDTSKIIEEERFDDLFEEIKKNPSCIKHVTHLISDEAQDISRLQFEFYEMIKPDNYMYFYDIRQVLYAWRDADPQYLIDKEWDEETTVYYMRQNFRNYADILRFAKKFLFRLGPNFEDDSVAMKESDGKAHVLEGNYTPSEAVDTLIAVSERLDANWSDWFVLCRTNSDIELFKTLFEKKGIPTDTFKQSELTHNQIQDRLKENTIKILTVHSAKGMEAPYILSYNIRAYNDDEAKVCYVSATRAKDFLIWAKMPPKRKKKNGMTSWE